MAAVARPEPKGLYRIKHASKDLYVQLREEKVELKPLDQLSKNQMWNLTQNDKLWKIDSAYDGSALSSSIVGSQGSTWAFAVADGRTTIGNGNMVLASSNLSLSPSSTEEKYFMFVPVYTSQRRNFEEQFFTLTPQKAAKEKYDIIIIGTGIGGGVLAADLFETNHRTGSNAKKILVIEKGHLIFHSHCLNASRPAGLNEDRGQQNDTFFDAFKSPYNMSNDSGKWKGGPMYCLGGRSAAWGLFAPRIHDKTLMKQFPDDVKKDLVGKYYKKAERLMNLSLPVTKPFHQHLIDRLNMGGEEQRVNWQWGRIASEFSDTSNFDFAEGAYSTIDRLLEIAMSKPAEGEYHKNFKILLGVEARQIKWDNNATAVGVHAESQDGKFTFDLNPKGKVVVCAGSVDSPAILMRSGVDLKNMGGCRLTDHDIIYRTRSFRYNEASDRKDVGAMKLQTYARIGDKDTDIALVNMSLDASTFLPRSKTPFNDLPKLIMVFILWAPLLDDNKVELVGGEPVVTIKRYQFPNEKNTLMKENMKKLTNEIMATIKEVLNVEFINDDSGLETLQLGGVAHELGTIPMPGGDVSQNRSCLDKNLKLNGREGVYVCDLSVFPYSPEANPTLTLAALALRLSRTLVSRKTIKRLYEDCIHVVNHSGSPVRVFVSNRRVQASTNRSYDANEEVVLEEGRASEFRRKANCAQSVSVFRLDPAKKNAAVKPYAFSDVPEVLVAYPGKVLAIQ